MDELRREMTRMVDRYPVQGIVLPNTSALRRKIEVIRRTNASRVAFCDTYGDPVFKDCLRLLDGHGLHEEEFALVADCVKNWDPVCHRDKRAIELEAKLSSSHDIQLSLELD